MNPQVSNVLAAAESLSAAERRELIDLLSAGLDDPLPAGTEATPPALTEAWRREVAQRSAEYDAGQAETVEEVIVAAAAHVSQDPPAWQSRA